MFPSCNLMKVNKCCGNIFQLIHCHRHTINFTKKSIFAKHLPCEMKCVTFLIWCNAFSSFERRMWLGYLWPDPLETPCLILGWISWSRWQQILSSSCFKIIIDWRWSSSQSTPSKSNQGVILIDNFSGIFYPLNQVTIGTAAKPHEAKRMICYLS